jgi:hypothetical protein
MVAHDNQHGDYIFLEDATTATFATWVPFNNFYGSVEEAWWDLYRAIEYGLQHSISIMSDRVTDVLPITDHTDPLFNIGNYVIIPAKIEIDWDHQVSANAHIRELNDR